MKKSKKSKQNVDSKKDLLNRYIYENFIIDEYEIEL